MLMSRWLVMSLYLLTLINPMSKVSILAGMARESDPSEFRKLIRTSSLAAAGILLGAMIFGNFILTAVFHVDLFSLRLAGGAVLFWTGFNALRKGVFFERDANARLTEMAIVPLACPMIAGPASITACIELSIKEGPLMPIIPLFLGIAINHVIMRGTVPIAARLQRYNVMGAMIRLTGLFVMTLGAQMALDGIRLWMQAAGD